MVAQRRQHLRHCSQLRMVLCYPCDPSPLEMESGASGFEGHPQLHREFKTSLSYIRLCLKKKSTIKSYKNVGEGQAWQHAPLIPATQEAKAGGFQVRGPPSNLVRP